MSLSTKSLLQEMFSEMVVKKNASLIAHYYHPDFILETNGQKQNYHVFSEGHKKIYATDILYDIRYDDDETWIENAQKVAGRVWIKTQCPNEAMIEFEVILIATYIDRKIHRLWEVTWPDWSQVKAFKKYHEGD